MIIKDFFSLDSKGTSSTLQAHMDDLIEDENGHKKLIKGNYEKIKFPLIFRHVYGKQLRDILDTGYVSLYLISDKMKLSLEENQLTGWKTFPIKLYDKKGNEIFGYHGFSIIGCCGATNYKASEIIERRLVPTGPICKYYKGIFFDNWDGCDFFTPEGTYQIFITEKAANILKKNHITNMWLLNLTEYEVDILDVPSSKSTIE